MQNNQQPPNPTPQVPDQRFNEIMQRLRQSEEQNAQLRGQVDMLARQTQPGGQQPQAKQVFQPDVDQALTQKFQQLIEPMKQQFSQQVGMLYDRTDKAEFELRYRNSNYGDLLPKVEDEMARNRNQGQWLPREQILQKLYFDETGKRAQEPAAQTQQPKAPVYDTYTGQWTDPVTGQLTTQPQQVVVPPGQPPQAPTVQQMPPPVQQQVQAQPQGPNWNQQVPPTNNQWVPNLPASTPPPAAPAQQVQAAPTGLTLEATPQALEAWANKFGDMPL